MTKTCFLCNNEIDNSSKTWNALDLGKEGIVIPEGMTTKDVICEQCYDNEQAKYQKPTQPKRPSIQIRGASFHKGRVLTPEEIKEEYERGPPSFDDDKIHVIDHKDEDEGYLEIDGKKVRKYKQDEEK